MTGYFLVLDKLTEELNSSPFVSIVTEGLGDEIDLSKQTIFPLSHINIISATPIDNIVEFNVDIYAMDIVDFSDNGLDNKIEVLNAQYNVILRLYESLRRGDLWEGGLEITSVSIEFFEQAYDNYLAGARGSFTIQIPNHMSIC